MSYFQLGVRAPRDEDDEELGLCQFQLCPTSERTGGLRWYDGVALANVPVPIELSVDDLGGWATEFPDYWSSPIPLASRAFKDAVDSAGVSNIQWFPVKVVDRDDSSVLNYFAFNIVGAVRAASRPQSVSSRLIQADGADFFEHLVLDSKAVAKLDMFRLAESLATIVVSQRVRDAVERGGVRTVAFLPLHQV